jgi:TonB family protein
MTAVMRAVAPSGPRALRVGVFVDGRIVEERIVPRQSTVTVGSSEKAMIVVGGNVPPCHALFERSGDHYVLHLVSGLTGRVATSAGVVDLVAREPRSVQLDDESRGKIVVGDTTLLFQLVAPPPVRARPQLPLSVKQGLLAQIDWPLTVIAAFSFLLHFGLVGGMYSDWGDTVVSDNLTVGLEHIVQPPAMPAPVVTETTDVTPAPSAAPTPTQTTATAASSAPTTTGRAAPRPSAPDPNQVTGLMNDLARLNIEAIGMKGGPNLIAVMSTPDAAPVDLNALWNRETRIDNRSSPFDLPSGVNAPLVPGRHDVDLPVGPGPVVTTAPEIKRVVPFDVHEDPPMLSGTLIDAEAVIRAQIHPGARRCYQSGLNNDPMQSGKLVVQIRVGPSGEVVSASVASNTGLTPQVAACVLGVARNAKFSPPGPNGATVMVPFNFLKQGG